MVTVNKGQWRVAGLVLGVVGLWCLGSASAAVMTLGPSDDVYITDVTAEARTTNYNYYPESDKLIARHSYIGPSDTHSLLKFDLSGIPDTAVITSASLHVLVRPTSQEQVYAYRMADDNWDETTVTFASYEGSFGGSTYLDHEDISVIGYDPSVWYAWDMSLWEYASDLGDDALTIMLTAYNQSVNYTTPANMASKEYRDAGGAAYIPYLEVEYVPEPMSMGLLLLGGLVVIRRR